jgi:capsular exopolysaccharide synthesis family protein
MPANLITLINPRSPAAEAYRTLRTNLMFYRVDHPLNSFVVTSPLQGEGKSTVLANLAVTFAQGGHDTLIVDCDLRRPTQHELWDLKNDRGLTSMLIEDTALEDPPVQPVSVERLSVVTSGPLPPNPADVVASHRMEDVIASLRKKVEYVLFDAPPVLAVTDAALLGLKVDGVLLVLRAGTSRRDRAARTKEELERVKVSIVGTVLVNAPHDSAVSNYYTR